MFGYIIFNKPESLDSGIMMITRHVIAEYVKALRKITD